MPTNEASAESAATGATSDRADAGDRTSTGDGTVVQERSEGPSADTVLERAANTVTTSTGAHSSSNDPSEAPVSGGAGTESMTSSGTDPAGESSTPTTREGMVLSRTPVGRWGAGLRAASTTTSPTQPLPAPVEVPPATTEVADSGPRMVQRSGDRGPRRERAVEEARRLSGIPFDEVPPADRDAAVNGPLYDSHVIPTVEMPQATRDQAGQGAPGTVTKSMEEPIIRRDQGAPGTVTKSMEEPITRRDRGAPGTVTKSMEEPIIRRDRGAPAIVLLSMEIRLIDHRDVEDPGTEATVRGVDPKDSQDPDDVGTRMTSMRTRPIDHRDPDGPETRRTSISGIDSMVSICNIRSILCNNPRSP